MDYMKTKELDESEKVAKVREKMESLKEKITQMNTNLAIELETFEADRVTKFKRILGCKCYSEKKKAEDIAAFVAMESKNFPFMNAEEALDKKSNNGSKKFKLDD